LRSTASLLLALGMPGQLISRQGGARTPDADRVVAAEVDTFAALIREAFSSRGPTSLATGMSQLARVTVIEAVGA
jgi:hypothetical protein